MSKKMVIFSSSPRKKGNSDLLCHEFASGAKEAGHLVDQVFLGDHKINYCLGCGVCFEGRQRCPQQDDMAEILEKIMAADIIVMATPVYFYSMSAQMKTLIDRTCSRYTEISHKEFYFILTAAEHRKEAMERTLEGFRGFLDCLDDFQEKGIIYGTGVWKAGEIQKSPALKEAYEMGFRA